MKLEIDMIHDIAEMFSGKTYAFTAVVAKHGMGLGVAEANVSGYTPVPEGRYHVDDYDVAAAEADRLNREVLELDDKAAIMIISSTMVKSS